MTSPKIVCSTSHLFHYFFNPTEETIDSVLSGGIRPLSDFPDSPRWKQLEEHMPGFYKNLYGMMAEPVLKKPYVNSGIFITPIDFRKLPGTYLHDKPRFNIPVDRIDPDWSVVSYVVDEERISLRFSVDILKDVADFWHEGMVREWFARDNTKVFFYVPQIAAYQGVIRVTKDEYDDPGA